MASPIENFGVISHYLVKDVDSARTEYIHIPFNIDSVP